MLATRPDRWPWLICHASMLDSVRWFLPSFTSQLTCSIERRTLYCKLDLWTPEGIRPFSQRHLDRWPIFVVRRRSTRNSCIALCTGQYIRLIRLLSLTNTSMQANRNLFPFNSSFWAQLQQISDTCGYTDYLDKFVTYPPAGQLPLVGTNGTFSVTRDCRIHSPIQRAIGVYVTAVGNIKSFEFMSVF